MSYFPDYEGHPHGCQCTFHVELEASEREDHDSSVPASINSADIGRKCLWLGDGSYGRIESVLKFDSGKKIFCASNVTTDGSELAILRHGKWVMGDTGKEIDPIILISEEESPF